MPNKGDLPVLISMGKLRRMTREGKHQVIEYFNLLTKELMKLRSTENRLHDEIVDIQDRLTMLEFLAKTFQPVIAPGHDFIDSDGQPRVVGGGKVETSMMRDLGCYGPLANGSVDDGAKDGKKRRR